MFPPHRQPEPRPRTRRSGSGIAQQTALAVYVLAVLPSVSWSQEAEAAGDPLNLRASEALGENITAEQRSRAPVFLQGARMSGHTELETVVEGDAMLRKADTVIRAERLDYDQSTDLARAKGNVRINRAGNRYTGPYLELKLEEQAGYFDQPSYQFAKGDGHGEASRAVFLDESHSIIHNATYTTCRRLPGPSWMPDWILRATSIEIDNEEEVGIAHGAYVSFKGVPILPVPAISFPLTSRRKSGLLPPTWGVDSVNGTQISQPYYWNIAPNRDATITPTLMTARGVDVGGEFRYLEPSYSGTFSGDYMPADKLRNADRWGAVWTHNGTIATGPQALGNVGLALNINRVSDDNYWRDFTRSSATLTQRLLPATGVATWAQGPLSGTVQVQQWQVLQDPLAPIVPPYDRVPQITTRYGEFNPKGLDWSVDADLTQFEADRRLTLQPNAQRMFMLAQASRPWIAPQGYITPKLQLHASTYQFDGQLANGSAAASSAVPSFSLDAGLQFERETRLLGRDLLQTLEPRAFYVRTPYRNQADLPNYDTGQNDFNFATIFTENSFVGHDKIADNNLLTLGLTTRFLDAQSGAQLGRFGVAQRLRLEDQRVTLNNAQVPEAAGLSDVLVGASVNAEERWVLDSTAQYNQHTGQSVRSTVGARYFPGPYRVINAAYRFQRNLSEQIDMSWQWPLNDLWGDRGQDLGAGRGQGDGRYYFLGRMNYSMNEGRLVDTLLGLEYDAGCWIGRIVIARTQTSLATANERLMFQLEFVGFSKVGIDPRSTLTQSIARYQNLRDSTAAPSRFSNYD